MDCPIELRTKFENKWWRLNNLYWILDEDGNRLPFKCNFTQEQLFDALWYFNLVLKARQHGVTTFTDLYFLDECIFNPTVEAGIIAHNKDDAQKIFRRKVKYPYENLPDWLKRQRTLVTDSRSELAFNNGSILYVGTSMRSATCSSGRPISRRPRIRSGTATARRSSTVSTPRRRRTWASTH